MEVRTPSFLLPRLGLGMAALGRPGYINLDRGKILGGADESSRTVEAMQDRTNVVMDRALEIGVNWFDCARSYGLSEKFVGEYLRGRGVDPDDVCVSSKWGYTYVADWNVRLGEGKPHEIKDHSVENFLSQVEETADFLGEYVRLYQVHSATFESGILTDGRVHEALARCKRERGWRMGLSVSGPSQDEVIRAAMKIRTSSSPNDDGGGGGDRLFDSVQCTFNLMEQKPLGALREARDAGMDVIVKEGLANGRLLRSRPLMEASEKIGASPDQYALASILAQPFHPSVLSGAVTPDQLESNHAALELSEKLGGEYSELLEQTMRECAMPSEAYWKERADLAWN